MSSSLIKLIEYSLLPAVLMIIGKIAGVYITAFLFNIDLGVMTSTEAYIGLQPAVPAEFVTLVSSYSDLIMFMFVGIGFSFNLISAVYFHDTHIETKTINALAKFNLLFLINSSFQLYHSGIIWFVFTWMADLIIFLNAVAGKTYAWIFIVATLFSLALTVALFRDLSQELDLTRQKLLGKAR